MNKRAGHLSTVLLFVALVAVPLAIWTEQTEFKVWQNRLVIPEFNPEPDRHTPLNFAGTFLPPEIKSDLVLDINQNPVIITGTTVIPQNVTVTLEPGVSIYANEFSQLIVHGHLVANGELNQLINFTSNETHPLNQTWGGVVISETGQADFSHTKLRYGSPAISCLDDSRVSVTNSLIEVGSMGVLVSSPNCSIAQSQINGVRDGIVAIGTDPIIKNTVINASRHKITNK